jgi:hypothetical protein
MYTIPINMCITFIDFAIRKYETAELTQEAHKSNCVHLAELVSFPLPTAVHTHLNVREMSKYQERTAGALHKNKCNI